MEPVSDPDYEQLVNVVIDEFMQIQQVAEAFWGQPNIPRIIAAARLMASTFAAGGRVFACGNGGSMSDAMHFAEELSGRYREDRPPLPALALSDPGHLSCVANDYGYEHVFARALEAHSHQGDTLLAISTSGQSPNVVRAAETARERGMHVVGLTGRDGGRLAPLCTVEIRVPHDGYADRIQELHIQAIHIMILLIERLCFPPPPESSESAAENPNPNPSHGC